MSSFLIWLWLSLFRFILKLIHITYSGYELLDVGWLLLKRKFKNFLQLTVFDSKAFVSGFVKKLEKCPSHFVVIIGENGINLKDFSNLVIWCLAAKISFITFYDHTGNLKKNKYIYYQYLVEKIKIDPSCIIFDLGKQSIQNGVSSKIHINILSMQDGKPLFVDVTKRLGQSVISNRLKISEINEKLITSELYEETGLPEPDLGVICGKTFGTLGFLPWHIRVTEFLYCETLDYKLNLFLDSGHEPKQFSPLKLMQMKNLNGMEAWEFTSALMSYSSCTQRFGK